ncbi:MAG TPA: DUF3800 domain-containing protein [Candidatus Rifleibacterium sp.]|nr:DUF3800 domain-containing protein [Candidatus Rifleibacterium sp.]
MKLIYIDESGDTGFNLNDPQQPIFVLAALVIPDLLWPHLESEYRYAINEFFPDGIPEDFELHVTDMKARKNHFKNFDKELGAKFRDRVLEFISRLGVKVFYRRIIKKQFQKFCEERFGIVRLSPYLMALSMLWFEINKYLNAQEDFGMLIFDDNKHYLPDVEKAIRSLRLDLRFMLSNNKLIEKGFFVDSKKSIPIQLTDLLAYYIRKYEEHKLGKTVSKIDQDCFSALEGIAQMNAKIPAEFNELLKWAEENWR